ncbi:helix-turn-helix transcriptional regulator [Marinobacter nauticus]|uniref:AlpA family transcriptional regulator n=1 Tax=Marinobacter nauticus TaxID=2743 RepID=A0A368UR38_MARNT|nr:AlpA family phage regulatory protein [Marinobacter nauticus]RBP69598.1 AlpA family transcriptional regulator [Marinobacter nauticus]RCW31242.1 AlpA family transcriptional regulator [Marinobacter nauticus]
MQPQHQPEQAFFRIADACRYLGMGRTKLHDLSETDPTFPRKIRISSRCVGWTRGQLDAWLESKQAEVSQ